MFDRFLWDAQKRLSAHQGACHRTEVDKVFTMEGVMGSDPSEAHCLVPAEERLNVFALVIYIADPLGRFLDDLRRELAPDYNPHAHVSVLPPRPLAVDWTEASEQARALTEGWTPFDVELTEISIFPVTNVVYLEVGKGAAELKSMHGAMNTGPLGFKEPFLYHPHVTLGQEIPPAQVAEVHELARKQWREFRGDRTFRADRTTFVQSTLRNCWIDLAEYSLGAMPAKK
jgi:2'-5' RNA ligase